MKSNPKVPVTVLVQTKNEEIGISACLRGLTDFDEVIVVDSESTDRTKALARAHGATVVNFAWDGQYPKKKQWQLDNLSTRNEWILFLDADETLSSSLIREIAAATSRTDDHTVAYDIDLDYIFAGRLLRYGHRVTKRCLLRRGRVHFPEMDDLDIPGMGELEGHYQPQAHGPVGRLKGRIVHNDLDPVASWFARHNRYSDWEANLRVRAQARDQVRSSRTLKGRIFDAAPLKPVLFFVYAYILRLGFLDRRAGFDYALALSMYYWQISLKVRELNRIAGESSEGMSA